MNDQSDKDASPLLPSSLSPPPSANLGFGQDMSAVLAAFAKHVKDRYYKGETIYLDGYTFTNCCFHNCILVTETGAFSIIECTFASTRVHYSPNAMRIIQSYNIFNVNLLFPDFNPIRGADGSITIR